MSKEANECIECRQPSKGFQTDNVKTRDRGGGSGKKYDAGIIIPETGLFTVGLRVELLED